MIKEKIMRIKREIEKVVRKREMNRKKRRKVKNKIVEIVGYKNEGK